MVDIHSHILRGLDDGPQSLDESLAMLRIAAAAGTTDIVATPHANSTYHFDPALIASRIDELRRAHPAPPRIHSGCDFHLSPRNIEDALQNPTRYTINSGRYLMVELPEMFSPDSIQHILHRLASKGILPVITHPERNPVLQRSPEAVQSWVQNGCFIQLTAQSFTNRFGRAVRQSAWRFLHAGLVHFVASDAHDTLDRPPRLDLVRDLLTREIGELPARRLLFDHPQAAIDNLDTPLDPAIPARPAKWYQPWRT